MPDTSSSVVLCQLPVLQCSVVRYTVMHCCADFRMVPQVDRTPQDSGAFKVHAEFMRRAELDFACRCLSRVLH
jgi:hypothetical protein